MLFSKKPESQFSLVVDIGSGSAGAALVALSRSGKPKIIFSVREPIPFQERLNAEKLPALMSAALEKVCAATQKDGLPRMPALSTSGSSMLAEALITFCPPWYHSETKRLMIQNIKPFAFTRMLAESAMKKEADEFEGRENSAKGEVAVLDQKVLSAELDGYHAENAFGRRAIRAEFSAYLSFAPKAVLEDARATVMKHFSPKELCFTAFPLVEYGVLRDRLENGGDFIMIDIGRELTEIVLVKKGTLEESSTFPIGKNHLIRELMKDSKTTPEAAISSLSMIFKKMAESKTESKARASIGKISEKWKDGFKASLALLSNSHYIPSVFYLLTQPDLSACFEELVQESFVAPDGARDETVRIEKLDAEYFRNDYEHAESADADVFLIISALLCAQRFADSDSVL